MKERNYWLMNQYTGELYYSPLHALVTIISDMIHFPGCRTWKMFHVTINR